ncbi:hypothetical protein NDU88_003282 [Pleurodeles waltl]|uniref:Uncharacterized protein n=1 Tax=Pleurodeles waltl TaxID=8319 RepID=A0AAV7KWL1_PLEWA|nr:hypothetical protein NDU88_003282 [Pleurodeles waltl]
MVAQVLPAVPGEAWTILSQAITDGRDGAKFMIRCGLDTTDSLGRLVASAVALRRYAWLRTSGFSGDVQQSLMDMPFDGTRLFGDKADLALKHFKDSRATARFLGQRLLLDPSSLPFAPFVATEGAPNRVLSPRPSTPTCCTAPV